MRTMYTLSNMCFVVFLGGLGFDFILEYMKFLGEVALLTHSLTQPSIKLRLSLFVSGVFKRRL